MWTRIVSHDASAGVSDLLSSISNHLIISNSAGVSKVFRIFEAIVIEFAASVLKAFNEEAVAFEVGDLGIEFRCLEAWEGLAEDVVVE